MEPVLLVALMTAVLLLLVIVGMPIAFAMGITGIAGIALYGGIPTLGYIVGTYPVSSIAKFTFSVVPLFILLGQLAYASGVASDAYSLANKWLVRLKGGLVMVTIGGCGLFAAATGSSVAEAAAMGRIAIPEMQKYGYDIRLATGAVASAGTVGMLIPPSISLALYGFLTQESIGQLFIAGILPGILSIVIYMAMVYVRVSRNPQLAPTPEVRVTWKDRIFSLSKAWGVILIFITVIGGLYAGIATPTEVGALGCVIALVMVFLAIARGRSNWGILRDSMVDTIKLCGMLCAFIIGAGLYSLFITLSGVLPSLVESVAVLALPRIVILSLILILYIPMGMFFNPMAILLVTAPITYPIIVDGLGYDGIWFGIIVIKLIELSVITPPLGLNLFVIKGLFPDIGLGTVLQGCLWFMLMDIVTIAILIAFPSISLWLPGMMQ